MCTTVLYVTSYIYNFCSVAKSHLTPCELQQARLPCPSLSPRFISIESLMLSNHLVLWYPLLLPSGFTSIRVFSSESSLHVRWPEHWSFSFSINPSNEYSGLISFRIDWFDLLAVQGTLKSFLQHHSSKASNLCAYIHAHRQLFSCYLLCFEFWISVSEIKLKDHNPPSSVRCRPSFTGET